MNSVFILSPKELYEPSNNIKKNLDELGINYYPKKESEKQKNYDDKLGILEDCKTIKRAFEHILELDNLESPAGFQELDKSGIVYVVLKRGCVDAADKLIISYALLKQKEVILSEKPKEKCMKGAVSIVMNPKEFLEYLIQRKE